MDFGMNTEGGDSARHALSSGSYHEVCALMICWENIDNQKELAGFKAQLDELAAEFRQYRFKVEHYEIESETPAHKLSRRFDQLIQEHDKEGSLLIVYYGGHGQRNDDYHCIWIRSVYFCVSLLSRCHSVKTDFDRHF